MGRLRLESVAAAAVVEESREQRVERTTCGNEGTNGRRDASMAEEMIRLSYDLTRNGGKRWRGRSTPPVRLSTCLAATRTCKVNVEVSPACTL